MLTIRSLSDFDAMPKGPIRSLIAERLGMLAEYGPYDPALGWFVVVEVGDSVDWPADMPCPDVQLDSDEVPFSDPAWCSPFEFCIQHDCGVFELVRVLSDAGEAVAIFVPDDPGIPAEWLTLCRTLAEASHADS